MSVASLSSHVPDSGRIASFPTSSSVSLLALTVTSLTRRVKPLQHDATCNNMQHTHSADISMAYTRSPNQQVAGAGMHRRLCFSLDEKALFNLHHPQCSSTASQQQSSEQSPQRVPFEPFKPPFEPPERVRTPDGVPSWPGVMEMSTQHGQQRGQVHHARQGARGQLSLIFARILKGTRDAPNGKRSRIRRALGIKRPRPKPRPTAPWRPPISGHSTYRFSA